MTRVVTYSEMKVADVCALQWLVNIQHELRVPLEPDHPAPVGSAIHGLIESYIVDGGWHTQFDELAKDERVPAFQIRAMMKSWVAWINETWGDRFVKLDDVIDAERRLVAPADGFANDDDYPCIDEVAGVADLLGVTADGKVWVCDHKTSGVPFEVWWARECRTVLRQLMTYAALFEAVHGFEVTHLVVHHHQFPQGYLTPNTDVYGETDHVHTEHVIELRRPALNRHLEWMSQTLRYIDDCISIAPTRLDPTPAVLTTWATSGQHCRHCSLRKGCFTQMLSPGSPLWLDDHIKIGRTAHHERQPA